MKTKVKMQFISDFQVRASQCAFLEQFNDIVVDVPAEDLYYLLQTFASMALSREINDLDFIRCVTTDLFKVTHTCQTSAMKANAMSNN